MQKMEVKILTPVDPLIKKYVECIYIFKKGTGSSKYVAYPSLHTAVGLFRGAAIVSKGLDVYISPSGIEDYSALAGNRLHEVTSVCYKEMVDEIAINFRPLGFVLFTGTVPERHNFRFHNWDAELKELFDKVFASNSEDIQLHEIEIFLLNKYKPITEEQILNKAIDLLSDFSRECSMQDIVNEIEVHYKYLTRYFTKYVGCTPAHFKKIARFRRSLQAGLKREKGRKLTDICYESNFTDQSYFVKQFRELTGENPRRFFRDLHSFSENYVVWKFV